MELLASIIDLPLYKLILVGMTLLGDCLWAMLIAGRLNFGRSILNMFDYMMQLMSSDDQSLDDRAT